MLPDSEFATALHEAGHCLAYIHRNIPVYFVTICNSVGDGMVTVGSGSPEDLIIGGFAGPWAQKLFSGEPVPAQECSQDFRQINRILDELGLDPTSRVGKLSFTKVAARPEKVDNLAFGYGVGELLKEWANESPREREMNIVPDDQMGSRESEKFLGLHFNAIRDAQ